MRLTVDHLSCARGGLPVLEGVSFSMEPGQALLLRGPNGAGKTTLLRTLAGLQPPTAGRVSQGPEAFAYAAHADGVKATMSVRENLAFWARIYGSNQLDGAVEAFRLEDLIDRPAQNLSAGQRRRLGLARLLVTGRPIWSLDEPTVSLDREAVAQFIVAVTRHLSTGGMALIATHVDLGLSADALELGAYRAKPPSLADFDEAFL